MTQQQLVDRLVADAARLVYLIDTSAPGISHFAHTDMAASISAVVNGHPSVIPGLVAELETYRCQFPAALPPYIWQQFEAARAEIGPEEEAKTEEPADDA